MRIIIGLGNVGEKYNATRHNLGFWVLDEYLKQFPEASFREEGKFSAHIASLEGQSEKVFLVKPAAFMNESGKTVRALLDFYKLSSQDILVIHDDLDLPLETVRITPSSGAAGHNGVKDIIEHLGTQDFSRIRIGIGRPDDVLGFCQPGHEYVLGKLTEKEIEAHKEKLPEILEGITRWLANSHE